MYLNRRVDDSSQQIHLDLADIEAMTEDEWKEFKKKLRCWLEH